MSRGPYKQYEYDPGICMPKSTCYKRKRNIEEVEENLSVCQSGEDFLHVNDEENEVLYKLKSWQSPKLLIYDHIKNVSREFLDNDIYHVLYLRC